MAEGKRVAVADATGRIGHHIVELLEQRGHDVVRISRGQGIDVLTGEGLADALKDVECIVDAVSGPWAEEHAATEFFITAARNRDESGRRAAVQSIILVSSIGTDRLKGYSVAKVAHDRATLSGSIPARVLRAPRPDGGPRPGSRRPGRLHHRTTLRRPEPAGINGMRLMDWLGGGGEGTTSRATSSGPTSRGTTDTGLRRR